MKSSLFAICALAAAVTASAATMKSSPFEVRTWKMLIPADRTDNAVCAPAGLAVCCGFLGDGIGGAQHAAIADNIGVTTDFAMGFRQFMRHCADLNASNAVEFTIANSIWSRNSSRIEPGFIRSLQSDFGGEVGPLASARPINVWTEAKTGGMIPTVITNIENSTLVTIVSAAAFRGFWDRPFPKASTAPRPFHLRGGASITLPTMSDRRDLAVVRRPGFRVTRLWYRERRMSLWLILPDKGQSLAGVRAALTSTALNGIAAAFLASDDPDVVRGAVDIALPKFQIETGYDILGSLRELHIPLSGYPHISNASFEIGQAVHHAAIITSEAGPGDSFTAPDPAPRTEPAIASFMCDRPFLFLVRDEETGASPFAGQFTGRE